MEGHPGRHQAIHRRIAPVAEAQAVPSQAFVDQALSQVFAADAATADPPRSLKQTLKAPA